MSNLKRFLTRAGETLARERGSIDRLCSYRAMLHDHPRLQGWFLAAMREAAAQAVISSPAWAERCRDRQCSPGSLRHWPDLERLPEFPAEPPPASLRSLRRRSRVAENCLADLGWSRSRLRTLDGDSGLIWWGEIPLGRCPEGLWHLPRLARLRGATVYSPLQLCQPVPEGWRVSECKCGRGTGLIQPGEAQLTILLQKVSATSP